MSAANGRIRESRPGDGVETKVTASTIGAYVATFLLTALLNGVQNEDHALLLGNGMPEWLETFLLPLLPSALTFALGWLAPHTHRPSAR